MYDDITLETVAVDTPNNVAVLSQMLQLNPYQRSVLFQNRTSLPFPILSHGLSLSTITTALTRALQSVNKRNKNIQCCQLKFFQCSQHKFYSSVSYCFHDIARLLYLRKSQCSPSGRILPNYEENLLHTQRSFTFLS
jgi:hypothetical protein